MRDVINPELAPAAMQFIKTEFVARNGEFTALDEWVAVVAMNKLDSPMFFVCYAGGQSGMFIGPEPFFVSGTQRFKSNNAKDGFLLYRAPRREMLPTVKDDGFDKFSPGATNIYDSGGSNVVASGLAATDWVYLNSSLQWVTGTIGTLAQGAPFGSDIPVSVLGPLQRELSARYFQIDMASSSSVGSVNNWLVHRFRNGSVASVTLTGGGAANPAVSLARVGDEHATLEGTGPFSQKMLLGSGNWTIAITNNVAADITTDLRVKRLGF